MAAAHLNSAVAENLRFLILEARDQVLRAQDYLQSPREELLAVMRGREDYVQNLRATIQRRVYTGAVPTGDYARRISHSADLVAGGLQDLERCARRLVDQIGFLEEEEAVQQLEPERFFAPVLRGIGLIDQAMFGMDPRAAVEICRIESQLDELYAAGLAQQLEELETGEHAPTQLTLVFVLRCWELMGDALLEVGEAILSACLGESVKAERLWALEDALGADVELDELELREVAETRSGARIRAVADEGNRATVIVKDGKLAKLKEERDGNARWRELDPALAPALLDFQEQGDDGAIVYEFASGSTLEDWIFTAERAEVQRGCEALGATLRWVWANTRTAEQTSAGFLGQLERRLSAVYAVHPSFRRSEQSLGGLQVPSLEDLIAKLGTREDAWRAPFGVYIHGDLNLDNVLYDPATGRVCFLDLHRTRVGDYAVDVSVLLVSLLRQHATGPTRERLTSCAQGFFEFFRQVADAEGDRGFEARLALGMARSFLTSTRFLLAAPLARRLYQRGRYLLERLIAADVYTFRLPEEVLRG